MKVSTVLIASLAFILSIKIAGSFKLNDIIELSSLEEGKSIIIQANSAGIEEGDYFIRTLIRYYPERMSIDMVNKGSTNNNNLLLSFFKDNKPDPIWKVSYTTTVTIPPEALSAVEVKKK